MANDDPEGFMANVDAGYESEQNPEVAKLKELGLSSQLEEVDKSYYNNLGNKKLALRQSPSPIVFEQVAKSEPKPKPPAKVVKAAPRPMVKAKPQQKNYQVSDEKAEENADNLWRMMGHKHPLNRYLPGARFVKQLPDGRWKEIPRNEIILDRKPPPKGGTRKRTRSRVSRKRNKRSSRRRSKRSRSRKNKRR